MSVPAVSALNLHAGGHEVDYEALSRIETPPPTRTWFPVRHASVLDTAVRSLEEAGYRVGAKRLAVSHQGARFFGTLDLTTELTPDGMVTLAVGLRNSTDQTFPMGFCAGSRVFVCSNLAFRADLLVRRKHTRFGAVRFGDDIAGAVMRLDDFSKTEAERIVRLKTTDLTDERAESLILRAAAYRGIIPLRLLTKVTEEWRSPMHVAFQPRTAWSLLNAFTGVLHGLQDRNPSDLAIRTMRLHALLAPADPPVIAA